MIKATGRLRSKRFRDIVPAHEYPRCPGEGHDGLQRCKRHAGRGKISGVTGDSQRHRTRRRFFPAAGVPFDPAAYELGSEVTDLPDDIDVLRHEIDRMDAVILAAVKRRSAVSKEDRCGTDGLGRSAAGPFTRSEGAGPVQRSGQEGHTLAMLLLRLGRGPLGR